MKRLGWEERLFQYVAASAELPFVRGENCCALWALGAVDAMLETSFVDETRGAFATPKGGLEWMRAQGWETLGEALADLTGATLTGDRATRARLGDLLFLPHRPGSVEFPGGTLALVYDGGQAVLREDNQPGVKTVPVRQLLPLQPGVYRV